MSIKILELLFTNKIKICSLSTPCRKSKTKLHIPHFGMHSITHINLSNVSFNPLPIKNLRTAAAPHISKLNRHNVNAVNSGAMRSHSAPPRFMSFRLVSFFLVVHLFFRRYISFCSFLVSCCFCSTVLGDYRWFPFSLSCLFCSRWFFRRASVLICIFSFSLGSAWFDR
jgi:hypothetical protein